MAYFITEEQYADEVAKLVEAHSDLGSVMRFARRAADLSSEFVNFDMKKFSEDVMAGVSEAQG